MARKSSTKSPFRIVFLIIAAAAALVFIDFILGDGILSAKGPANPNAPRISSITPNSGYIGTTITVTGSGFTPEGNILYFSPVQTLAISSSPDGNTVSFKLNSNVAHSCSPKNKCALKVENANGTSNALQFDLIDWLSPEDEVKVLSPNGGETVKKGASVKITWQGTKPSAFLLTKPEATTEFDVGSSGLIIGTITPSVQTDEYAIWNVDADPGEYKILLWSKSPDGTMFIASGKGATTGPNVGSPGRYTEDIFRGNWDLSDQPFTVVAP